MHDDGPGAGAEHAAAEHARAGPASANDLKDLLLAAIKDYAICTLDPAGHVTTWNEGGRRLLGYTADEMIGHSLHRIYMPDELAAGKPETELQTALATGRSEDEGWRVRKDGSRFWANEIVTPLRAMATLVGFAKISRDLSERRQAQEALQASEERQRLILESINDYAIFTQDEEGRIVDWHTGAEQMFGYTAEEAIGQPNAIVFTPEDRAKGAHRQEMQQARNTGRAADERWHIRKDGSRFFASGVLTPLLAEGRSGYVKVARDLTERRQMEERLEAQVRQRTAQVRELVTQLTMTEQEERRRVSAVLHDDLQQRLFSLLYLLASLRQALDAAQAATVQPLIGELEQTLRRSVEITRKLSVDLSPPVLHNEGLPAALQWLATQMQQEQGLEVRVQAAPGLHLLSEDLRVLLFHTVRELLFNIVKHSGVRAATVAVTPAGEQLRVEVSDQGQGFAPAAYEQASTSQGLRRIEQRMQLLGGSMAITSAPGAGTQVTLLVPLRTQAGRLR